MTFKVGDKVRCIEGSKNNLTVGKIYEIVGLEGRDKCYVFGNDGNKDWRNEDRFELVQEDKLPHELIGLPRFFVVKKDEFDPLWVEFCEWVSYNFSDAYDRKGWGFVGYDGNPINKGGIRAVNYDKWDNQCSQGTLITLAERDRCVNKRDINDVREKAKIESLENANRIYNKIKELKHFISLYSEKEKTYFGFHRRDNTISIKLDDKISEMIINQLECELIKLEKEFDSIRINP